MSDLIIREALIDFIEERSGSFGITVSNKCNFKEIVKMMKPVDAVEVVRCEDCKHRLESGHCKMCRHCDGSMRYVAEDEFCSMGIQKEVEE